MNKWTLRFFQKLARERFDNSIRKRDFLKLYYHQAANLNTADHNVEFLFGEIKNYQKIGFSYLQFDITIRKLALLTNDSDPPNPPNPDFIDNNQSRLANIVFAYCFKEARLTTTGGSVIKIIKYSGQVSTFIRLITSKDGD